MRLRIKQDQRGISNVIVVMLSLVILVIISANVILWSYQMNQLDWEKMQEDINIVDVRDTWSYNPFGYGLGGSTSLVSGSVSNLKSDDGLYLTFRSYYSGTDTSDFVDNDASDVDSSPNKGTHSNFSAQQYGPDSIYDTLTEENTAGSSSSNQTASADFDRDDWISGQSSAGDVSAGVLSDTHSSNNIRYELVETKATAGGPSGQRNYLLAWRFDFTSLLSSRADTHVYIEAQTTGETFRVYWSPDDSTMNFLGNITSTSDSWRGWDVPDDISTTIYILLKDSNNERADGSDTTTADLIKIDTLFLEITTSEPDNYELDLEVQWTNVDCDETNEELCIYGGTMDPENIRVDAWNGSAWENLFIELSSGWNNVSVSSYLQSSTFTIRFKDCTETSDATQDSWDIDVTLLHVWSDEYASEVEFTGSSNMEDWSRLTWTVDSAWTSGLVNVTLQLYNYALGDYPTSGNGYIAYTSSDANTDEIKNQIITVNPTHFRNATGYWRMKVKGVKATDEQFDLKVDWVEFKAVIASGTLFTFKNTGSLTSHLVSLWVVNSTHHRRYDIDVIINPGETLPYLRADISLPSGQYVVKVVAERGNIAVFSE